MSLRNENGGSLIEFAVIAPLLFVILFGIIEFGILLYDKAMITNASREGARTGIVYSHPNRISNDVISQAVRDYCEQYLISFGPSSTLGIAIVPNDRSASEAGDPLTVIVTYPYRFLVFSSVLALIGGDAGSTVSLRAETVMRLE